MSDNDVFSNIQDVTNADQLLGMIKNEKGEQKYTDSLSALKALANSQEHIARIERENAELREGATKAASIEDVLAALNPQQQAPEAPPEPMAPVAEPQNAISEEAIAAIVAQKIAEMQGMESRQGNRERLIGAIQSKYGAESSKRLYGTFESLGFSQEETNNMLETKPEFVEKMLDLGSAPTRTVAPTVATTHFQQKPQELSNGSLDMTTTEELVGRWAEHKALVASKFNS